MLVGSTTSAPLPQPETFIEKAKRKIREEPLVTAGTGEGHGRGTLLLTSPLMLFASGTFSCFRP